MQNLSCDLYCKKVVLCVCVHVYVPRDHELLNSKERAPFPSHMMRRLSLELESTTPTASQPQSAAMLQSPVLSLRLTGPLLLADSQALGIMALGNHYSRGQTQAWPSSNLGSCSSMPRDKNSINLCLRLYLDFTHYFWTPKTCPVGSLL